MDVVVKGVGVVYWDQPLANPVYWDQKMEEKAHRRGMTSAAACPQNEALSKPFQRPKTERTMSALHDPKSGEGLTLFMDATLQFSPLSRSLTTLSSQDSSPAIYGRPIISLIPACDPINHTTCDIHIHL